MHHDCAWLEQSQPHSQRKDHDAVKPEDLLFDKTHEWVHFQRDGERQIATVGISAFAVEQLTDLVYIALPEVGQAVKAGEPFGEIESVKAVSDLYSPVTGRIRRSQHRAERRVWKPSAGSLRRRLGHEGRNQRRQNRSKS